jgi:protein SCO1
MPALQNYERIFFVKYLLKFGGFLIKATLLITLSSVIGVSSAAEANLVVNNPLFELVLKDQDDHVLPLANYLGKTLLINFIFVSCGSTCPLQTRQLVEVQKSIPEDKRHTIRFLSVSVDPKQDTPAKLNKYANIMAVDTANWSFATGNEQAIKALTEQLHVFNPGKNNPQPGDHSNQLYLFDKNGLFRQRYNGVPIDIPRLVREIQQLDIISRAF